MATYVTFPYLSMCWNSDGVKPFSFNNTWFIEEDHPIDHMVAWTAKVASGAPNRKIKALVINCHGWHNWDTTGTTDSAGGIPMYSGGYGLNIGEGIDSKNADLFRGLSGLIEEIHIYACRAAVTPARSSFSPSTIDGAKMCQIMADTSKAIVVASKDLQPDVLGSSLNQAPLLEGTIIRFTPRKP